MAQQSQLPSNSGLSKEMIAYLQKIESRVPSVTTPIDPAATLADLIAAFNQLKNDLNR